MSLDIHPARQLPLAPESEAVGSTQPPRIDPTPLPDPNLLKYYALTSLLAGPFFLFVLVPYYFRYHTLRYHFDDEGVTMRWGILFRREISLTYARIQDIHLSSNVVERWLGLGRIQVQTASGSADAEMTIEGLRDFEQVRDFLYSRMRGARQAGGRVAPRTAPAELPPPPALDPAVGEELATTLRAVAEEVRALRLSLERGRASEVGGDHG